ncbi:MAG: ribonuclease HII [Nitriliruptoraceae bacterium]
MPRRRTTSPEPPGDGPDIVTERQLDGDGLLVAGLDEVGRGAWAGPLTVGVAILDLAAVPPGLRDSKLLTPERRTALDRQVRDHSEVAVGEVPHDELDEVGLAAALRLAAQRAVGALRRRPDVVLIDGNVDLLAGLGYRTEVLIGGDDRSASIAAASIVAKVHRDAWMVAQSPRHPPYGFDTNKGYATEHHRRALAARGPCELHRRSWQPIRELLGAQQLAMGSPGEVATPRP